MNNWNKKYFERELKRKRSKANELDKRRNVSSPELVGYRHGNTHYTWDVQGQVEVESDIPEPEE